MHGELGLWLVAFLLFVVAEIALVTRKELWLPMIIASGTGLFTAWIVLAKPSMWIDVLGVLASAVLLWRLYTKGPSTHLAEPRRTAESQ
jgi:hypothetical protein